MTPSDIRTAFDSASARSRLVPRDLRWHASVTSTMDVAEQATRTQPNAALVVVADEQTQGRGRRGRAWSSPPGAGLYLSFVFHPRVGSTRSGSMSLITLAAGAAVRAAIVRATGFTPQLKWPNDLMIGKRKLAGILAEALNVGTADETIILGTGVNLLAASHPDDIAVRATSLQAELGRIVDRAIVLEELLVAVCEAHDHLARGATGDILRQWRDASPSATGATVEWQAHDGFRRGRTAGIDDTGALLVQTSAGIERIVGGELAWL